MIKVIQEFIDGIIEKLNLQCTALVTETEDEYKVDLSGPDTAILIGHRGDVLDSLQYLTLLLINRDTDHSKRLVIDGENYRAKREVTLTKLAKNLAFKAAKTRTVIKLEPMNPFERRIIHSALVEDKFVTTESEGVEPNRYIVIKPNRGPKQNNKPLVNKPEQATRPVASGLNRFGGRMKSFGGEKRKFF